MHDLQLLTHVRGALLYSVFAWSTVVSLVGATACRPACPPCPPDSSGSNASAAPAQEAPGRAQQAIVQRAAEAVTHLRQKPRFSSIDPLLAKARAVAIFPRLVKASLIFGGEGGNGVVLIKRPDGSWSGPAFYSLAAPSVGLQAGVQATTVLLFIMNEVTVERMLQSSLTLGASTSATLGQLGERDLTETELLTKDIFELAESGGAFAGVSYEGYLITARQKHNEAYYGPGATPRRILLETMHSRKEADGLLNALKVIEK